MTTNPNPDPAAVSVVPPATNQTAEARDRIAEVLADADGWRWAEGFREQSPTWQRYQQTADAVLGVLPAPVDRAAAPQPEPTAEEIARANVLALHQIGEQLAGIESWMWEHLADARDAAKAQAAAEAPAVPDIGDDHSCAESGCTGEPTAAEAPHAETPDARPSDGTHPCGHDDYHDSHEWADRPGVWCPGHGYDEEPAVVAQPGKENDSGAQDGAQS